MNREKYVMIKNQVGDDLINLVLNIIGNIGIPTFVLVSMISSNTSSFQLIIKLLEQHYTIVNIQDRNKNFIKCI